MDAGIDGKLFLLGGSGGMGRGGEGRVRMAAEWDGMDG